MTDTKLGHNGGPKIEKFTASKKLERITKVLEMDISATQKCVGIGIIVEADSDGVASEISTAKLQLFASAKDRETVYRATRVLQSREIATSLKNNGKPNSYRVLPPHIAAAVEQAFVESRNQANQSGETRQGSPDKPDGIPAEQPVGLEPTGRDKPVGLNPTGRAEPVGSNPTGGAAEGAASHARIESPSGIVINNNQLASKLAGDDDVVSGLNGAASEMLSDIAGWMNSGDFVSARNWLRTFVSLHHHDVVKESYLKLKTDLSTGKVISMPLQTWGKIASRMAAEAKAAPAGRASAAATEDRAGVALRALRTAIDRKSGKTGGVQ